MIADQIGSPRAILYKRIDALQKAEEYRQMASVQEYVLIAQDSPHIQRYYRQDDINWLFTELIGLDKQLTLKSIDCVLMFSEVFRRIEFENISK